MVEEWGKKRRGGGERVIAEDKPERCHISKWVVLRGAVNTLIVIRCIRTRLVYTGCRLPAPPPPPTPPPLKRIRTYFRRSHLHRGERYGPGQPFSGSDMTRTSNNLPCPFPSPPPPVMPGGNCGIRGEIVGNWRSRAVACSGNCARANCLVSSANLPDANRPGLVCGTAGKGVAIERREG